MLLLELKGRSALNHSTEGAGFPTTRALSSRSPSSVTTASSSIILGRSFPFLVIVSVSSWFPYWFNIIVFSCFETFVGLSKVITLEIDPELFEALHVYFPLTSSLGFLRVSEYMSLS